MRSRALSGALLLWLGAWTAPAQAALYSCTVSTGNLAFGNYNPFSPTPLDSSGQVSVSCGLLLGLSLGVSYTLKLSSGVAGSYAPRQLASGGNRLSYNLYTTSARSTIWGNGVGGTATVSDSYTLGLGGSLRNYTVHGRVPARQNVPSGSYSDTITVTVEY